MIGTEDLQYINHQAIMMVESSPRVDTWMDWPHHHRHEDPSQIPKALIPIDPADINSCSKIIVKSDKQSNNVTKHKLNYFWWTKTTQMIGRILKGIWYMVYIYIYICIYTCFLLLSEKVGVFTAPAVWYPRCILLAVSRWLWAMKKSNKTDHVLHTPITTTTTTTGRSSSLTFNLHSPSDMPTAGWCITY